MQALNRRGGRESGLRTVPGKKPSQLHDLALSIFRGLLVQAGCGNRVWRRESEGLLELFGRSVRHTLKREENNKELF